MSQSFSSTPLQMTGMSRSMPAYYAHGEVTGRPAITFIIVSFLFHIVALAVVTGQFSLFPKDDDFEDMVVVEMVSEADLAQNVTAPEKKPEALDVPNKPKPAPKSDGVKPQPPEIKPAVEPEPVSEVEAPAPEIVEPEPAPAPKTETAPPPVPPKTVPKPTPPKVDEKPVEQEEEIVEEKPKTMDFQSVLKNLAGDDSVPVPNVQPSEETTTRRQAPTLTQPPPVSEQVSSSEMQALISQLGSCWTILSGAKDAANLYVDVYLVMNPDRTVRQASIVDRARYNSDSFFKAAADSALRALNNPDCAQLNLPVYKYEQWKTMTVRFDPKQMF